MQGFLFSHRRLRTTVALALLSSLVAVLTWAVASSRDSVRAAAGSYVVIAWNDLGMHCINPDFSQGVILPPYNNLWALVIKRGREPEIVTRNIRVDYSFPNNSTCSGKSNFWDYADDLFGVTLNECEGLTGAGLSGQMAVAGDHFQIDGIPLLPVGDDGVWDPYQIARVEARDATTGQLLAATDIVAPVSDEMHCNRCHGSFGSILSLHDSKEGTTLGADAPVLCANCHQDNALGAAGVPGLPSLSLAMHRQHGNLTSAERQEICVRASCNFGPACSDCHPGWKTRCNRSAIEEMGPSSRFRANCENCHGNLKQVAQSIEGGREPWLQEPKCVDCHEHQGKSEVDTGNTLYRQAKGHHGVYCAACHNSPHAWYPSLLAADNQQPLNLQGSPKPLGEESCLVCHTQDPGDDGPHEGDGDGGDDDDDRQQLALK